MNLLAPVNQYLAPFLINIYYLINKKKATVGKWFKDFDSNEMLSCILPCSL